MQTTAHPCHALTWGALLLGFSLGGFFDGILLHQVLQWHHLLSNVQAAQDMRVQILADGLFHALMYLIAAVALVRLWRARGSLQQAGARAALCGNALVGFGAWHIVDSFLSHWITGIHRIRVDSPNPLLWDLLWFAAFGVLPALIGWRMRRRATPGGPGDGRRAASALALAALVAGPLAALPAGDGATTLVLFRPGTSGSDAFNALAALDARVVWVDRTGGTWAVTLPPGAPSRQLYAQGALLVSSGQAIGLGCVSWTQARTM